VTAECDTQRTGQSAAPDSSHSSGLDRSLRIHTETSGGRFRADVFSRAIRSASVQPRRNAREAEPICPTDDMFRARRHQPHDQGSVTSIYNSWCSQPMIGPDFGDAAPRCLGWHS
jgi:hypothetical protein